MNKFIPTDQNTREVLNNILFRKKTILVALRKMGIFGNDIEVKLSENPYFARGITAIDNEGNIFTFEGSSHGNKQFDIMCEEKDRCIIYRIETGLNKQKLRLIPKAQITELKEGVFYKKDLNENKSFAIRRSIKIGKLKLEFATAGSYPFNEDLFIKGVIDNDSMDFLDFYELAIKCIETPIKEVSYITFVANYGLKKLCRIVYENGKLTSLEVEETRGSESLVLEIGNGQASWRTITSGSSPDELSSTPFAKTASRVHTLVNQPPSKK